MGNNKTKQQQNSNTNLTNGSSDSFGGTSSTSQQQLQSSSSAILKNNKSMSSSKVSSSNRDYLSSVISCKNMDSEIYIYGCNQTMFYDGINPGCGVTNIIENLDLDQTNSSTGVTAPYDSVRSKSVGTEALKLVLRNTLVYKIISGRLHTHIITADGKILSFGSNNHGQLACGVSGGLKQSFGVVRAVGEITNHFIIDGAGGGYHSLFITAENRVFGVGGNSSNQLGVETTTASNDVHTAIEIPSDSFDGRKVISCSAGDSHSCFLTSCGSIYFAGSNSNGSCAGVKSKTRPLRLVNSMIGNEIPFQIACGYDNTMILCQSGNVYGVGCNSCGQLATTDGEHSNYGDIRHIYQGTTGVVWIGSGYFCSAVCSLDECYYAPSQTTYSKLSTTNSNIIAVGVGDSIIFATNEISNELSGKYGKLYVMASGTPTDITGEFSIESSSSSSKIEFSAQRDVYIAYASKVDPAFMISHHFLNLEKILGFVVKSDSSNYVGLSVFSDIVIQHGNNSLTTTTTTSDN